ncbi:MAG: membrane protein insertase YidC [Rhodospirillaceae bacterium]|nr:membrane protein insertase YidC [Rhodospirillaceae bacterium]MBT6139714.1 membrane protein insertase YidC [Rhodospirillaceae bacterium]
MNEQKNLILAVALSVLVVLGYEFFYSIPQQQAEQARRLEIEAQQKAQHPAGSTAPTAPASTAAGSPGSAGVSAPGGAAPAAGVPIAPGAPTSAQRDAQLKKTKRLIVENPRVRGSISLTGARFDDLILSGYRETIDTESSNIHLLNPGGLPKSYLAEFGWVPSDAAIKVPNKDSVWTAKGGALTPESPVTLSWSNGAGLTFERVYEIDDQYLITIVQRVRNTGASSVTLFPYGLLARGGTPETLGFYILHEGLLGVFGGTLTEVDYSDIQDEGEQKIVSDGGWIGITDKYWQTALLPNQTEKYEFRFKHTIRDQDDRYQVDYLGGGRDLAPGNSIEVTNHLFAGAKEVRAIDAYEASLAAANFDLSIDFGWFYFLTKPFFYIVSWLSNYLGNFGLAILAFTILVKLVFFPLANKSYKSMAKMRALTPKLQEMREQYGDDRARLNQEMMELYKKEKVNPASGCLPIVVQIPVFFALYKVLFVNIEMRHAPFFGWIQDLSAPDPTSLFTAFGFIPWDPPQFLAIGIWPIIMGVTMWMQQRLNPQPTDPVQAKIFAFFPFFFTFLLASFPAGLVIYWAWNNTLSMAQQWVIMKRMGVK